MRGSPRRSRRPPRASCCGSPRSPSPTAGPRTPPGVRARPRARDPPVRARRAGGHQRAGLPAADHREGAPRAHGLAGRAAGAGGAAGGGAGSGERAGSAAQAQPGRSEARPPRPGRRRRATRRRRPARAGRRRADGRRPRPRALARARPLRQRRRQGRGRAGRRAVTVGEHIAFASGEYRPGTPVGDVWRTSSPTSPSRRTPARPACSERARRPTRSSATPTWSRPRPHGPVGRRRAAGAERAAAAAHRGAAAELQRRGRHARACPPVVAPPVPTVRGADQQAGAHAPDAAQQRAILSELNPGAFDPVAPPRSARSLRPRRGSRGTARPPRPTMSPTARGSSATSQRPSWPTSTA